MIGDSGASTPDRALVWRSAASLSLMTILGLGPQGGRHAIPLEPSAPWSKLQLPWHRGRSLPGTSASWRLHRISCDHNEKLIRRVRLHDHFPAPGVMRCLHDPASSLVILVKIHGDRHHTPEIDFGEAPIDHALQDVGAELKLLIPPRGPVRPSRTTHQFPISILVRLTSIGRTCRKPPRSTTGLV